MQNQSIQELIENLPVKLKVLIMDETEVKNLHALKVKYKKSTNVIAVINARIENLTYLAT